MNIKLFILLFAALHFYACDAQPNKPASVTDTGYVMGKASDGGTGKFYFGREIARVMGASNSAWLDRDNRQQEENSQLTIDHIKINDTGSIADVGAGTGYYTFKLAKKFPHAKIYAVEIQDEMIATLNKRKEEKQASKVEVIKGDTLSPNLPANSLDLIIMVDVYHELEYPREMIDAIKKSLKKNGKLLLIEYKAEDPDVAIRPLHKMTVKQVNKEMTAAGFTMEEDGEFLPIQHFLLFKKIEE